MINFKKKKRVLFLTEGGFCGTGYGNYSKELLSRLYNTHKYDLAEFSCFTAAGDPRDIDIKWRLYNAEPSPYDKIGQQQYKQNEQNRLGSYRFDKVLLDFQPDIFCNFKDATMVSFTSLSPLRKFYYEIASPSIDSSPQCNDWLGYYLQCDKLLGYTNFALDVIKKECGGKAKIGDIAWPGANFDMFKPIQNKNALRQTYGINPDSCICCMAGRNQIRKLFPELMKSFRLYLDKIKAIDINTYNNSLLYLQCTLPDLRTWDINKILIELGIENKTLFSYTCLKCNRFFPNKFQDVSTACRFCGNEAILPRVSLNISQEYLNQIYNLTDIYVHVCSASAAEFPIIEAAAAGTNVMATDHAGSGDVISRLQGVPLKILASPREINVGADRAFPDNEFLADELVKFFRRPRQINLRNGLKTSEIARKKFSWDKNAEIWEGAIDSAELTGYQGKWAAKVPFNPQNNLSENIPLYHWIYNFIDLVLQEPHLKNTIFIDELIKFANAKLRGNMNNIIPWGRKEVMDMMKNMFYNKQAVEQIRTGKIPMQQEDWISYAETKELSNLEIK